MLSFNGGLIKSAYLISERVVLVPFQRKKNILERIWMGVTLAGLLGGDVGSGVDQARRGDGGQCQGKMRGTLA